MSRGRLPAIYGLYTSQRLSQAARWFAGLNGGGLLATFALMIAGYTQHTEKCESHQLVADALKSASIMGWWFFGCGIAALLSAIIPALIGVARNFLHETSFRPRPPPISLGGELNGLSEIRVTLVYFTQLALLLISAGWFLGLVTYPLHYGGSATPEGARQLWSSWELACKAEEADRLAP